MNGLSTAEATERLARVGANALPERTPDPVWRRFLRQFGSPLIYILLFALAFDLTLWVYESVRVWPGDLPRPFRGSCGASPRREASNDSPKRRAEEQRRCDNRKHRAESEGGRRTEGRPDQAERHARRQCADPLHGVEHAKGEAAA